MLQHKYYDIIVLGAGSAGLSVSGFMGKAGFKTLLVDLEEKDIGGECLNYGCIPSKAFIQVSRMIHASRQLSEFGYTTTGKTDIEKVLKYVRERQEIIRKRENSLYLQKEMNVDVVLGNPEFRSENEVTINGDVYNGKQIVIATGSSPRKLDVKGWEQTDYYNNENIFNIKYLPDHLLVMGAGNNGVEMAQAFQRLGSKVTVVQDKERILPEDDPKIVAVLKQKMEEEGVKFFTGMTAKSFPDKNTLVIESQHGRTQKVHFDAIYFAIGREVDVSSLKPEKAGIETKDNKLVLDEYLQTTNKNVFACGDVVVSLKFSHGAEFHARLVLNNFFSPIRNKLDYKHFSWCTFTDPEVAVFGYSEQQLKEEGIKYEKLEMDFNEDDRAVIGDYQYGRLMLLITEGNFFGRNKKILGGSMVAPEAGEMIQELILANSTGIQLQELFDKIYPYPVRARVNQGIIRKQFEDKLTPLLKRFLRLSYQIKS
ncbi:MAG: NAD(P)/FAD-dependent oxidoreductase [Bacteroidia bacterium]